jgi:cell division protein FtsQ
MRPVDGDDDDIDAPPPRRKPRVSASRSRPRTTRPRRRNEPATLVGRWAEGLRNALRWSAFWGVLLGLFFLAVTVAGLISGGHVSAGLERLRQSADGAMADAGLTVATVTVDGHLHTQGNEVTQRLNIKRGDLMLYVDVDEARARIETLPWVKSAQVRRIWPNRIVIKIEERRPVARWLNDRRVGIVDSDGAVVGVRGAEAFTTLPLLAGKGAPEAATALVALLATQPELKSRVKIAVRMGERRWNLQLDNAVEVRLPEVGAEAALAELVRLDRDQKVLARDIKAIDLRFGDRYVVQLPPSSPLVTQPVKASGGRDT